MPTSDHVAGICGMFSVLLTCEMRYGLVSMAAGGAQLRQDLPATRHIPVVISSTSTFTTKTTFHLGKLAGSFRYARFFLVRIFVSSNKTCDQITD
ncbi:hypothetical protein BaRGS_00008550 [Batillaria attramentaria]|uniref:Secreted protein n=1 Tax=Batillaria attramentaria TaxID=370345 RepID=A0ABD0LL89_9CAEN